MAGQPTIWPTKNDCVTVKIDESKRTNDTSVTLNNTPIQEYVHPDDHAHPSYAKL